MLRLTRPTIEQIRAFLDAQPGQPYSYAAVGATRTTPPAGYDFDRHRVLLGYGGEVYAQAQAAIRRWTMFPTSMARLCWPDAPIEVGTIVAVLFRAGFLWSLNAARIVYVIDEVSTERSRYGFAYGTLVQHVEQGEELFAVEHHAHDDSVWYELSAFSKPQHPLARLAYLYARRQQARFRELSGLAMQRAVHEVRPAPTTR